MVNVLSTKVPDSLYKAFKEKCESMDLSVSDVLFDFAYAWVHPESGKKETKEKKVVITE